MNSQNFGHYQLVSLIGRCDLGETWKAIDTRGAIEVAVKLLDGYLTDDSQRARFFEEMAVIASLNSSHIMPILDFGELDGQLYTTTSLYRGTDLASLLSEVGPIP